MKIPEVGATPKKDPNPEGKERSPDHRRDNVDEPVWQKRSDPEEDGDGGKGKLGGPILPEEGDVGEKVSPVLLHLGRPLGGPLKLKEWWGSSICSSVAYLGQVVPHQLPTNQEGEEVAEEKEG